MDEVTSTVEDGVEASESNPFVLSAEIFEPRGLSASAEKVEESVGGAPADDNPEEVVWRPTMRKLSNSLLVSTAPAIFSLALST
jgi:hypothetical protein